MPEISASCIGKDVTAMLCRHRPDRDLAEDIAAVPRLLEIEPRL